MTDAVRPLVAFGRKLRGEGVRVGTGQVVAWCEAVAMLDPTDVDDLYWAGRSCLVSRREDIGRFDRAFDQFFRGRRPPSEARAQGTPPPAVAGVAIELRRAQREAEDDGDRIGSVASSAETLRRKPFADCTPEELAELRALLSHIELSAPRRLTRRTEPHRRGTRHDLRRSIRRALRSDGELLHAERRRRRQRARRIVLLLDVSGSMAEYSRALLQFAHAAERGGRRVETFCFGTRLTRVTADLARRDPDAALRAASERVLDWDGGTRIGDSLEDFLHRFGRPGLARGAVVVICSDGLERGDPDVLAAQMERLSRVSHRIVWVNPLKGNPAYEPLARGMNAALPWIDVFVPGHDFASLEALAGLLAETR
jgi:uncharacterized protein